MHLKTILVLLYLLSYVSMFGQGVAINENDANPDQSAILDISSTNKGVLIPRLSEAQRIGIPNPSAGLLVYQSNNQAGFWYYSGTAWTFLSGDNSSTNELQTISKTGDNLTLSDGGGTVSVPNTTYNNVTIITPPACQRILALGNGQTSKIADLGTFFISQTGNDAEIEFQTHIYVESMTATGVRFELRVNNNAQSVGTARVLYHSNMVGTNVPIFVKGYFENLSFGTNTVSIYAISSNGTANNVFYDRGCFSTNALYVKEINN